jgi:hypothetical protein
MTSPKPHKKPTPYVAEKGGDRNTKRDLSDRHDFFFLGSQKFIDFLGEAIGLFLDLLQPLIAFVFGDFSLFLEVFDSFIGVAADISDGDPSFLGHPLGNFGQFLAPFLAKFGNGDANDPAIVFRGNSRLAARMAFSMAGKAVGSKALMTSRRASGVEIPAISRKRVRVP